MIPPCDARSHWLEAQAECGRRLGRKQRHLCAGPGESAPQFPSTPYQSAWALLGLLAAGEARSDARAARCRIPDAHAAGGWAVERSEFHGARISAGVLFAISRLFRLFPAVGAGRLPHSDAPRNRSLNAGMGVVAALEAEARTLGPAARRRDGLASLRDGALAGRRAAWARAAAAAAAHRLVDAGASALMSFGLAGGLDPSLTAGSVVMPGEVISRDGARFPPRPGGAGSCALAISRARAGVRRHTAHQRAAHRHGSRTRPRAFRETGAVAVDMESLAVARSGRRCTICRSSPCA